MDIKTWLDTAALLQSNVNSVLPLGYYAVETSVIDAISDENAIPFCFCLRIYSPKCHKENHVVQLVAPQELKDIPINRLCEQIVNQALHFLGKIENSDS